MSDNQGVIDWRAVKDAGVEFAVLRSTRGSGKPDRQAAANVTGCREQGIPFSFYKYQYALTEAESAKEAEGVLKLLAKLGVTPSRDTLIWSDIEYDDLLALGKEKVTDIINAFKAVVETAGFGFGVYCCKYDYEHRLESARFTAPMWIARYYRCYTPLTFGYEPDESYRPAIAARSASELLGWQFTSTGRVPGIRGNVDLNETYKNILN